MGEPSLGSGGLGLLPGASVSEGWLGISELAQLIGRPSENQQAEVCHELDRITSVSHWPLPANMLPVEGSVSMKDTTWH